MCSLLEEFSISGDWCQRISCGWRLLRRRRRIQRRWCLQPRRSLRLRWRLRPRWRLRWRPDLLRCVQFPPCQRRSPLLLRPQARHRQLLPRWASQDILPLVHGSITPLVKRVRVIRVRSLAVAFDHDLSPAVNDASFYSAHSNNIDLTVRVLLLLLRRKLSSRKRALVGV